MTRVKLGAMGTDRIDELKNVLNRADGSVPFMILSLAAVAFLDLWRRRLGDVALLTSLANPRPPFWVKADDIENPFDGSNDA
jgi:hypothetical protein